MPISRYDATALAFTNRRNLPVPIGPNAKPGDLRVVRLTAPASRSFPTLPDGWARESDPTPGSGGGVSRRITFLTKVIAEGDTDFTVEFDGTSNTNGTVLALTLSGADLAKARSYAYSGANAAPSSGRSIVAPTIAGGDGLLLTYHDVTRTDNAANTGSWGGPAGMTVEGACLSDTANGYNALVASEDRAGDSGATGTRTATAPGTGSIVSWSGVALFVPAAAVVIAQQEPGRMLMAYA